MKTHSKILAALIADARYYAVNMPAARAQADAFARSYFNTQKAARLLAEITKGPDAAETWLRENY